MKKWMILAVFFCCLACFSTTTYAQDDCSTMQEYVGFMQQLASALKAKESMNDSAAVGNKLNNLISFLTVVNQRMNDAALSNSLDTLQKVWMNQSFDATNRGELGEALEQSANDLQAIYSQHCTQ